MADRAAQSLDGINLFFLSTFHEAGGPASSYSIDVEKADDSHYSFTVEAMSALDQYLTTRYAGATLVDRLKAFIAELPSAYAVEKELRRLIEELSLEVKEVHYDTYDWAE